MENALDCMKTVENRYRSITSRSLGQRECMYVRAKQKILSTFVHSRRLTHYTDLHYSR